jgi:acetylornithine deacetylase/succinyl-diaminopimelate desuccinylase-like protein
MAATAPRADGLAPAGELGQRTAELLAELVRIPSVNPPGAEAPVAERVAAELAGAGLEVRVIPTPRSNPADPERAAVWARLPGRGNASPLVLLSHLDVVPADPGAWSHPPFSGEIEGGKVYGRGTLDAKGVTAIHVATLLELARRDEPLGRDIIFLATPDEETGGRDGAAFMLENHPELLGNAEFLLTEGGSIRPARSDREGMPSVPPLWGVTVTEKGPCWLELTSRGTPGHGSAPRPDAAIPRLIEALDRVRRIESPIRVIDEVASMFRALAPSAPREDREGFASLAQGLENDASFRRRFLGNPGYAALVRNTISITVLEAGSSTNVVPGHASARLDVRLLPGEDCTAFREALGEIIADSRIEIDELLAFPSRSSASDTLLFSAIERVAHRENPEALVVPRMIAGFTDAHWFRERGIVAYGFVPRWLGPADSRGVHGVDESVSVANLEAGVLTLIAILEELEVLSK